MAKNAKQEKTTGKTCILFRFSRISWLFWTWL